MYFYCISSKPVFQRYKLSRFSLIKHVRQTIFLTVFPAKVYTLEHPLYGIHRKNLGYNKEKCACN